MQAPDRAELHVALLAIRQAAEKVKAFEPLLVEQLLKTIHAHVETVNEASGLTHEADARRERIVAQCRSLEETVGLVRQYPEQIQGRAKVLDQAGALARIIRESLPLFAPR